MRVRHHPGPIERDPFRRVRLGLLALAVTMALGVVGYLILGLAPLDAVYQTVTTVFTVGYREVGEPDAAFRVFTIGLIVVGVGTALYTLGVLVESLVEGGISDQWVRRRMQRDIDGLAGHVIICGWGRVGRSVWTHVTGLGEDVVVVERDEAIALTVDGLVVIRDATDDDVLERAGLSRARVLIAALDSDTSNLYVTLSGRAKRPDLFIVARARVDSAEPKLLRAGAHRVVNPQQIGGARIAAMAVQPHVADFLDVVMHDGSLEFRLADIEVPDGSALAGRSLRDAQVREHTGAMVLAIRGAAGDFHTNPPPDTLLTAGSVLIAIGTGDQLDGLRNLTSAR